MLATLKASARSRGSNESLPSISGRAPQTHRDNNTNNMMIEEMVEDEAPMEPLNSVREKPQEMKDSDFDKSEKDENI